MNSFEFCKKCKERIEPCPACGIRHAPLFTCLKCWEKGGKNEHE